MLTTMVSHNYALYYSYEFYSGTSIIQSPLGPYQTVLIIEVSLVGAKLVNKHAWSRKLHSSISGAHLYH